MAAAPARPQTLTAISDELPPCQSPGVFPRRYILRGETVLFETRPSLLSRYWGRLTVYILLLLLFVVATTQIPSNGAVEFFDAIFLLLIIYTWLAWKGTVYALTDRRVLATSGVRSRAFQEIAIENVQNLSQAGESTGRMTFDSGIVRNPSAILSLHRSMKIVWGDLPDTPQVYRYVQDAFSILLTQARKNRIRQALLAKADAFMVTCEYCKGLIDVRKIESDPPKCPRCGAPMLPKDLIPPGSIS